MEIKFSHTKDEYKPFRNSLRSVIRSLKKLQLGIYCSTSSHHLLTALFIKTPIHVKCF